MRRDVTAPFSAWGWALALALSSVGCLERDAPPGGWGSVDAMIENVALVTMEIDTVLPDGGVAVSSGSIAWVGPATAVPADLNAARIDGQGHFLMPGLIDLHVHASEHDLPLFLAAGVTTVLFKHGAPEHLEWRSLAEQGKLVSPRIFSTGPMIAGREIHWPHAVALSADEARALVREHASAGYDFIKVYDFLSPAAYDALSATARELGIPFLGHVPQGVSLEHALAAGQLCIDHAEQLIYAFAGRERSMELPREAVDSVASSLAGRNACVTSTLFGMKAMMMRGSPWFDSLYARPAMELVDAGISEWWSSFRGATPSDEAKARRVHFYESQRDLTRRLVDSGVTLAAGTDTPNLLLIPGYALHDELEILVDEVGLSPFQALRAVTAHASTILGRQEEFGVIVPGASADLLLVNGNSLDDVSAVRRTIGVMMRGRWYGREELARLVDPLPGGGSL